MATNGARGRPVAALLLCLGLALTETDASADEAWRPDSWVTAKVKLALSTSPEASALDVNVDTIEGRVTLHGKVDSNLAKAAAEDEARAIEGVLGVENLLQVVPPEQRGVVNKADAQIEASVNEALSGGKGLSDSHVEVESVHSGVVLLGGQANDLEDRLLAVRTARAVPGVKRVESQIVGPNRVAADPAGDKIADAAGKAEEGLKNAAERGLNEARDAGQAMAGTLSDAWITAKVKSALIASEQVPALRVNVDTTDGVVTLFGKVETLQATRIAEQEARGIGGVAAVVNRLEVVPAQKAASVAIADDVIHDRISREIASRKRFSTSDIEVEVSAGVVRLTGQAPNAELRQSAAVVARSVDGVRAVRNELQTES